MVKRIMTYRDPEEDRIRAARILGYGGLIPFWALVALQFFEEAVSVSAEWALEMAVVVYGAVIVSFMGGGRWTFRILDEAKPGGSIFFSLFAAVLPPLLAWAIAAWPEMMGEQPFTPLTRGFLIGLLLLYQLGQEYVHRQMLPVWYLELRVRLSLGAAGGLWLACLVAALT